MGTTRIKVIDLSSNQKEIKTSRKHAEKLTGIGKLKAEKKTKEEKPITESTEKKPEGAESSVPSNSSVPAVIKSKTPKKNHTHGKKYQQALSLIDKNKVYTAEEAIELLRKTSYSKFDPTLEIHLNVLDKNIRGQVNLPYQVGKKKEKKILIFTEKKIPDKNVIIADTKTIEEIVNGTLRPNRDFDLVIAEPKFMPQLAKVAKILGPQAMMPNPKNQTITENPQDLLNKKESTNFEFKTEPTAAVIHTIFGKLSFKKDALLENLKILIKAIGPTKIKGATVKSTMSPPVKIDISSLTT